MYAVDKGDTLSVEALLEAGASIDCKVSSIAMPCLESKVVSEKPVLY